MTNIEQTHYNNPVDTSAEPLERQRTNSQDYTLSDEWDASKTPPSRFQKRKGSIYATPSSRDGHVARNRDAVEDFHKAHSKRWSISSSKSGHGGPSEPTMTELLSSSPSQRRKSTASGTGTSAGAGNNA